MALQRTRTRQRTIVGKRKSQDSGYAGGIFAIHTLAFLPRPVILTDQTIYEPKPFTMTIRRATDEDMESIYMMGFDAWGSDTTEQEYLQSCRSSEKYKLGTWYCLEKNNERLSSIIIYSGVFGLQEKYGGFGSISTNPMHRNKGYAGELIADSIKRLEQEHYLGIFLFSEVGTSIYGKYGFCQVGGYEKDGLMFLGINGGSKTTAPSYF